MKRFAPWLIILSIAACSGRSAPNSGGGSLGQNGLPGDDPVDNDGDNGGMDDRPGDGEDECGECTSDADCNGGTCTTAMGECLPSCDCPMCDVCAGHCDTCNCGDFYAPVCGRDGRTYPSECDARCAGAGVACQGECPCERENSCGDGICDGARMDGTVGETCETCPADCGPCEPRPSCGDGVCQGDPANDRSGESCRTCPADCGECGCVPPPGCGEVCGDGLDNDCDGLIDENCDPNGGGCGDGVCDLDATTGMGESCQSCPADCGPCGEPTCGDGVCDGGAMGSMGREDCQTCPVDCGDCPGDCVPSPDGAELCGDRVDNDCDGLIDEDCDPNSGGCGDGICDLDATTNMGETCQSCPSDCGPCGEPICGDGVCDGAAMGSMGWEDCQTCPVDCGECGCVPPPGCGEICGDRVDNDCNGLIDEGCNPPSCVCGDGVCQSDPMTGGSENCESCPEDCGPCTDPRCGDGVCDGPSMNGTAGETCETCPADCGGCQGDCVCPENYDPVCGQDGMSYSNECLANCAGVMAACQGECPCPP